MKKVFKRNLLFWIYFFITHTSACPFAKYEDGLLTAFNPISIVNKKVSLDSETDGDSIAFGYWSFSIPLWEVTQYPIVQKEFSNQYYYWNQGQLLFLVKPIDNIEPIILGYQTFDNYNIQVQHHIAVEIPLGNFQEVILSYSSSIYEGKWIFTLLTFLPQQSLLIIEMTDQEKQIISVDQTGLSEVQIIIGGRGMIEMNSNILNLDIYRGRLSHLISEAQSLYNPNNFLELSDRCQIPQKINGIQTVDIVPGFKEFDEDTQLQFVFDEVGNRYYLSGWVKYDTSTIYSQSQYTLLRLTTFKNYLNNVNFGDYLFYLMVSFWTSQPSQTAITAFTNPYSIPNKQGQDYGYYEFENFKNILYDPSNDYYHQALQKWHFLQYEYGRTGEGESKFLLQIQFFNQLGRVTTIFGTEKRVASFTNTKFYIFFGGDDDSKVLLHASVYNFKFEYNYNQNQEFFFYGILKFQFKHVIILVQPVMDHLKIIVNHAMLILKEFFYLNKKYANANKITLIMMEMQIVNYFQRIINLLSKVKYLFNLHHNVNQAISRLIINSVFDGINIEVFSPQQSFRDFLCVDCLYNPLIWFQKLICTADLIARNEDKGAYHFVHRAEVDYDLYLVDDSQNLFLLEGAANFCYDTSEMNCHETSYFYQGIKVSISCKENYYFTLSKCVTPDPQCLKSDKNGQCLKCLSGMYIKDNVCYQCPATCQSCKFDQHIICESCYEQYTIVNGECIKCGSYCQICKYFEDQQLNTSYTKCYKCIDNQQYMVSFDGQNCIPNPIVNCIYAFQALKTDITVNTIDYYFLPQQDLDNIQTYCGLCQRTYVFNFETFQCEEGFNPYCDFAYALWSGFDYYSEICLISYSLFGNVQQFNEQCSAYSSDCEVCIRGKLYYINCLICQAGYYSQRLSGKCLKCPEDLHCAQCIQQDSFSKDKWKDNIRAFYRTFIENDYKHPFIMYGQTQNPDDYEIICQICQSNYELVNNQCILSCPEQCLECQLINGENICVKCQMEQNGRRLSLINNQCVQCPTNCALCRERSKEDIYSINPLFNNSDFILYTYQCLRSFDDVDYFYDQEIGQFIKCIDNNIGCEKQFVIPLQLHCSEEEYTNQLNKQITEQNVGLFKRQNIFIQQLFSGNSFSEVLIYQLLSFILMSSTDWLMKNKLKKQYQGQKGIQNKSVTQMEIQFQNKNLVQISFQQCKIDLKISDVELQMIFQKKTTFVFDKTLTFQNFKMVKISQLTFQPIYNDLLKQIIFEGSWPVNVELINSIYTPQGLTDKSQILFYNLNSLFIQNFNITNLFSSEIDYFIYIQKSDQIKLIDINSLTLVNCVISNQIVFIFDLGNNDQVFFKDIEIQSTFNNASLISTYNSIQTAKLNFQNIRLILNLNDCGDFFNVYTFFFIEIVEMEVINSKIINSNLINLNNYAALSNILIQDSKFRLISNVIINSNLLLNNILKLTLKHVRYENISYDETTKFINFRKFSSENSTIEISNINLIGNQLNSDTFNSQQITSALLYIELQIITITEITIHRGYGLIDLAIAESLILFLSEIIIKQHPKFSFLGLHQYLDCQFIKGQASGTSIYIFLTKQIEIRSLQIIQTEIYNEPLIFIQSADLGIVQQTESINISNILAQQNLLLLTKTTKQTTLIKFESSQEINLILSQAQFLNNILHEYQQNQVASSATLFVANFYNGNFQVIDSLFSQNFVTNSSDSILKINSNSIIIKNCDFNKNSIFIYEVLQPYLLWGYPTYNQSATIYLSNIQSIFPVLSNSGQGLLSGQIIKIIGTSIINSTGALGGGFQIIAQNQASIQIEHCIFRNISSLFISQNESGGAIYFDGSNSQSFNLQIQYIEVSNIYTRQKGGLIYISAGLSKSDVVILNIQAYDVYSSIGSILCLEQSNLANSFQTLTVNDIQIINQKTGFITFLNRFTNIIQQEINTLVENRCAFYINFGRFLIFKNISINNLILESAISLSNARNVSIVSLSITNSQSNKNFLNILTNTVSDSFYLIRKFKVIDSEVGSNLNFNYCPNEKTERQFINFQCIQNAPIAPQKLEEEFQNDTSNCTINNMNISKTFSNSGLITFIDLNILSQIKLDSITLINIDCNNCEQGLISASYQQTDSIIPQIIMESIIIQSSRCGKSSCVVIGNDQTDSRLLQENKIYLLDYELIINHYYCTNNTAYNGTCLMISNLKTLIKKSNFQGNIAQSSGGTIFIQGSSDFIIEESIIENNTAKQGGGYFSDQLMLNTTVLKTIINDNKASFFGDNQVSSPTQLTLTFNGNILPTHQLLKTDQLLIDQVFIDQLNNTLYLPTGQLINQYQYYDWKKLTYIPLNWKLRLLASNQDQVIQKNLKDTNCNIQSRLHNLNNQSNEEFINNYTNLQQIQFNEDTQDYNLDNLIIYFNPDTVSDIVLQLQFQCNSIKIPIYNNEYPYNILNYHQNYYLRLQIKSFKCQLGEIKQNDSCIVCDSKQGLYSLQLNAQKCSLLDDITTISVKPAQLNIKQGYWRPYIDTNDVNYCFNLHQNCLGGWIQGDNSCFIGHIGALCEECDLYNVRGSGQYSRSSSYSCGTCQSINENIIIISAISIWTLLTILISVKSTLEAIKQFLRILAYSRFRRIISQEISLPAILIKMLTNYFQIIATISTFQLSIPIGINDTIKAAGNPIQPMIYTLDCILILIFDTEIHYARMIWRLLLPFLYYLLFLFVYYIGIKVKWLTFTTSALTTTFFFIYIYLQPNLVGGLVQLISYRLVSGFKWIQANVSYRYDTSYHLRWILEFCLPALTIIAFITPLIMFIGLYFRRQKLQNKVVRLHWGYLYNEYKQQAYFWEIIKIIEKELILIFLAYYEDNIVLKSMLVQIIIMIYYQMSKKYSPYNHKKLNDLDAQSVQTCIISIVLAVGIYITQRHNEILIPFFFLLAIINLLFILKMVGKIVIELIEDFIKQNLMETDIFRKKLAHKFPFLTSISICKRLLASRVEQKNKISRLYKKLKSFLLPQARQIIAIRESWQEQSKILLTNRENTDRQRFLLSDGRLSSWLLPDQQQKNLEGKQFINISTFQSNILNTIPTKN